VVAALAEPITLAPLQRYLVPTGLVLHIPSGFEVQVRARSGLAIKHGITLVNAVGTIDSDYRHELMVPLINLGNEPYTVHPGDRIAQLVLAPVVQATYALALDADVQVASPYASLPQRQGGFGSTGR
jgi:dUTP pyrophosphatase